MAIKKRDKAILVRLTADEYQKIITKAKEIGLSKSTFIRMKALENGKS